MKIFIGILYIVVVTTFWYVPMPVFAADECATDADCVASGQGNACKRGRSRGAVSTCEFTCTTDSDCQNGQLCVEDTGLRGLLCVDPPSKAGTGDVCTVTEDCSAGLTCIDTTDSRGGRKKCYAICNTDADCSNGNSCTEVDYTQGQLICANIGLTPGSQGTSCEDTSECDTGLICNKGRAIGRRGVCTLPTPTAPTNPTYEGIPYSLPSSDSLRVGSARSLPELIGDGIRLATGFFGSIALLMIIYGGFQMILAAGQGDKVKQGATIIVWASIGLVTMMLSYVLVSFVFGAIT